MARKRGGTGFAQKRRGIRVIAYIRVSDTTGREETLISDAVQLNEIRRLAAREGLEVVGVITELDKSGRESTKRAIGDIIGQVEKGEADGVLVWKISRWGRNTIDSMLNISELNSVGGFILSATENLDDIDTPAGRFSLVVLLAIAQMYSDEIGKTWANIHDYRRREGKTPMGGERFGYIREDDEYRVSEVTGPWMRDAYRWYVSGEALNSVVGRMRAAGIMSTRGNQMTYNSLLAAMDSGFAAGLIVDRRGDQNAFTKGSHEALIDEHLWTAYQRRRAEKVPPRVKHAPYRLAGLLVCTACGGKMIARWKYDVGPGNDKRRYFRCHKAKGGFQRNEDCTHPAQIDESRLNRIVRDWLLSHAEGEEALSASTERAVRADRASADRAAIERKIGREKRRLSILADKVIEGAISTDTARMKETEIRGEIALLTEALDDLTVDVEINSLPSMSAFGAVAAGWDLLDPALLNEGLRKVVRVVEVTKHPERFGKARVRVVGAWEPSQAAVSTSTSSAGSSPLR